MMSSDILSSRSSQELLLYLKYILKLIFKGFFLINRCLIFKVRRSRFASAWILYHTTPQLSTLFFAFFIRFFQPLRVFCGGREFYWVYRNVMEVVFYWGWCFIGLLLFYYYTFGFAVFTSSVACGVLVWEPSQGRCGHRPLQVVWWYRAFSSSKRRGRVDRPALYRAVFTERRGSGYS